MSPTAKQAASRYRQARITLTVETTGRISYSIAHKALRDAWDERSVVVRDSVQGGELPTSVEDVYRLLMVVLGEQLLPGHIG